MAWRSPQTFLEHGKTRGAKPVQGWVGLVLHRRGGLLFIKRVIPGWPAEQAGLLAGDQVLSVGGLPAQAPSLDEALDALAGPAGTSVDVWVKRPGKVDPVGVTVVRTASPVPEPPAAVESPDPDTVDRRTVEEAARAWSLGRLGALDTVLAEMSRRAPDRGARMALLLVERLLDQGGEAAWRAAYDTALLAAGKFPEAPESLEAVQACFRTAAPPDVSLAETAQQAIDTLARSSRVPAFERVSMTDEWARLRALGWMAEGRLRKARKALASIPGPGPVGLVAIRPTGDLLWHRAVAPSPAWQDIADRAMLQGDGDEVAQILETVLQLDEPPWVYPMVDFLTSRGRLTGAIEASMAPRWAVKRPFVGALRVRTEAGDEIALDEVQRGYAALLLNCERYDRNCESWRVALADVLNRGEAPPLVTGIVTPDPGAPPSMPSWPVFRGRIGNVEPDSGDTVLFLDPAGHVVGAWGRYEMGLEYHVLARVRRFQVDPDGAGPFLVRGGVDTNGWTLRWTLPGHAVSAFAWGRGRTDIPSVWVLSPAGELTLYRAGERIWSLPGFDGLDHLVVAELDGDSGDEFLAFRTGDGLLEVLDGTPTPLWIGPGRAPIAFAAAHDLDRDGLDEVFVAREGRGQLVCYRPDGTVRWRTRIPHGVASLAFGRSVWMGELIAVSTRRGEVFLLAPDGRVGPRLDPGIHAGPIVFADVDGDTNDELVVGGRGVQALVAADMRGAGGSEVIVRVGAKQQLLVLGDGRLAARLTWEYGGAAYMAGEMDGDSQEEVALLPSTGAVFVLDWLGAWGATP